MGVISRSYFSIPYLRGAAMLAREVLGIEGVYSGAFNADVALEHRAKVVAGITSSVAALEAMINEAFADADEPSGCLASIPSTERQLMAELWKRDIPRTAKYPILQKFDIAHLALTGVGGDRGDKRWRDANYLVILRNTFVHFEPTWERHGPGDEALSSLNRKFAPLKGLFPENPIAGEANPFYPDKLLGHGCAEWSFKTSLAFADHFWSSIGVVPPYQSYRPGFGTR